MIYIDQILQLHAQNFFAKDTILFTMMIAILAGGLSVIKVFRHLTRRQLFFWLHLTISFFLFGAAYFINSESVVICFIMILLITFLYQALTSVLFIYQTEVLQDKALSITMVVRIGMFAVFTIYFESIFSTLSTSFVFCICGISQLIAVIFIDLLVIETKGLQFKEKKHLYN